MTPYDAARLAHPDPVVRAATAARIARGGASPETRVAAAKARAAHNRRRPEPWCLYAEPTPGCLPIRCHAGMGCSCGKKYTSVEHCIRCLYPEK